MSEKIISIALDAMGGDFAPQNEVAGAIEALKVESDFNIILVGNSKLLENELLNYQYDKTRISVVNSTEVITMKDSPTKAVKEKVNSSLVIASKMVHSKEATALVSAGNTGAVTISSILNIGRIKGVNRPTIAAPIPNEKGSHTRLSDAGAFVDSKAEHLFQFAKLTTVYLETVFNKKNPTVGLLNVGEEESKGYQLTLDTRELLENSNLNFIGNVEGKDIMKGKANIVVCDGFVGNIVLKFAESILPFLKTKLKDYASTGLVPKIQIGLAKSGLSKSLKVADPNLYGGVPLLGINGITIIGHGSSSPIGIKNMILEAVNSSKVNLVEKLSEVLNK